MNGLLLNIGEEFMSGILCILFVFKGMIVGVFWEVLVVDLVVGIFLKGFGVVVDVELGMLLNILLLLFVVMIGIFCIVFVLVIDFFFFWFLLLNFGRMLLYIGLECLVWGGLDGGDWDGVVCFEWFVDVENFFKRLLLIEECNVFFFDVDLDVLKFYLLLNIVWDWVNFGLGMLNVLNGLFILWFVELVCEEVLVWLKFLEKMLFKDLVEV